MQRAKRTRRADGRGGQSTACPPDETGVHVDFRVRSDAPSCVGSTRARTRERLQRLESEGYIDSFTVDLWGTLALTDDTPEMEATRGLHETVDQFRSWARDRDLSLQPAFRTREIDAMLDEEVREELVPPMFCVAVYSDSSLDAVFPHADEDGINTVCDALDRLATGESLDPTRGVET